MRSAHSFVALLSMSSWGASLLIFGIELLLYTEGQTLFDAFYPPVPIIK